MLLVVSATGPHAADLSWLLHKNPERVQSFALGFGRAHVFYPRVEPERCDAALLVEVDPIRLVRGQDPAFGLDAYVNDRPYVASSFLSVALARVFGSALGGRCQDRPELVERELELRAAVSAVAGGASLLRMLFEPLGYAVETVASPLDEAFPQWGPAPMQSVTLTRRGRLCDLLSHLYVLLPVLDDDKHYWVGDAEVEKLLRHGEGWLAAHPARETIAHRYLRHQRRLTRAALARLAEEDAPDPDAREAAHSEEEAALEQPLSLHEQRLAAVVAALRESGARRVLDLGCGEGRLLRRLLEEPAFAAVVGMDVSARALELAAARLHLDRMPPKQKARLTFLHGSLTYRDRRLAGYDGAAVVEVVEHLDPPRLEAFERVLFEVARPGTVVLTTPNREYNVRFAGLLSGRLRHRDHRFEWTREEFAQWCDRQAARFGYAAERRPIGADDPEVGPPTQMAVFTAT